MIAAKGHSAFDDGVISPGYAAIMGGGTVTISAPNGTFDFIGASFTGGWGTVTVDAEGYSGNNLIYTQSETAYNGSPTWYDFNFMGIDRLVFIGYGDNTDYAVDNFTYNLNPVPEPTTMLLLGSGLISLAGFRRKMKNSRLR